MVKERAQITAEPVKNGASFYTGFKGVVRIYLGNKYLRQATCTGIWLTTREAKREAKQLAEAMLDR